MVSVPLDMPEYVGHRAEHYEHEEFNSAIYTSSDESGQPDPADSSSEDELGVPGERLQRMVKGRVKYRRVRKPRETTNSRSSQFSDISGRSSQTVDSDSGSDAECRAWPGEDPVTGSSTGEHKT